MMKKTQTDDRLKLSSVRRSAIGTSVSRHLRSEGYVPGVVYGKQIQPIAVAVNTKELTHVLHTQSGEHALLTLRIEDGTEKPHAAVAGRKGEKTWEKPVLVKVVQHDPVHGHPVHVDFHVIVLTERLRVKVPVELKGEPAGVKEQDGVLEHFLREVEVECLPTEIPSGLQLDISHLKIGDTVHVRDLTAPGGIEIMSDGGGVLASVQAPKEEKVEEEVAATEEPEVISEKKEEKPEGEVEKPESKKEEKREEKKEGK